MENPVIYIECWVMEIATLGAFHMFYQEKRIIIEM